VRLHSCQLRRLGVFLVAALLCGAGYRAVEATAASGAASLARAQAAQPQTAAPAEAPAAADEHAEEEHAGGGHTDPFSTVMLELALIMLAAAMGRWAAMRSGQPAVLGELLIGVVIGNIAYAFGSPLFTLIMHIGEAQPLFAEMWTNGFSLEAAAQTVFSESALAPGGAGARLISVVTGPNGSTLVLMGFALWLFSNLGVILLLFMVGLESSVDEMLRVGPRATVVALIGIVAPFALSLGATLWLLPLVAMPVHIFIAATLCATSVGITARVFKDLHRIHTPEAKTILGAAVIDDILGLIILAVVVGIVATGEIQLAEVGRILLMSLIFLGTVIVFGERFVRVSVELVRRIEPERGKLLFPLALAFLMSWIANQIELATIVGAFAAGLIINEEHFADHYEGHLSMEGLIGPLEAIFAPVFFVLMGLQVNLTAFVESDTIFVALALTVAAILGKIVSGLGAAREMDRLSIGLAMIPRGEVGLIFASIGKGLGVVTDSLFSAVVLMVIVTTLITPLALRWSLFRAKVAPVGATEGAIGE
jgi:Kef-type K+ transport system membrane component KefB